MEHKLSYTTAYLSFIPQPFLFWETSRADLCVEKVKHQITQWKIAETEHPILTISQRTRHSEAEHFLVVIQSVQEMTPNIHGVRR